MAVSIVTALYIGVCFSMLRRRPTGSNGASCVLSDEPRYYIEGVTLAAAIWFGMTSVVIKKVVIDVKNASPEWCLLIGAVAGFKVSLIGRFGFRIPSLMFGMTSDDAWKVHVIVPMVYALVFRFYVYPVLLWALGKTE